MTYLLVLLQTTNNHISHYTPAHFYVNLEPPSYGGHGYLTDAVIRIYPFHSIPFHTILIEALSIRAVRCSRNYLECKASRSTHSALPDTNVRVSGFLSSCV